MRLVATGSSDRTVKLFDVSTQSCIQTFYQNTGAITCVQFHPFGNVLATGCADHSIKLLDLRSNQLLQHYSAHDLAVSSIAFHPTGNFLLSSSLDSSIRLWDLRKGHQLYTIHGHPSPVHSAAFNHDGSQFVTGGADQRVITWNTNLDTKSTKNSALPKVGVAIQTRRHARVASSRTIAPFGLPGPQPRRSRQARCVLREPRTDLGT
jgi:centriolar protein POC1